MQVWKYCITQCKQNYKWEVRVGNWLKMVLSQNPFYWALRMWIRKTTFFVNSKVFAVRGTIREGVSDYTGLRNLFLITQRQLVVGFCLAVAIQLIDPIVYGFYKPTFLKIPDDTDYVTLLATISGMGGVFIGLYYAAISTVGGAIYSSVPNNIRDLLAHDRVGNVYMQFLAQITFLGLSLIAFRVLGMGRLYLAVPVMLIAAGVGIIAFVKLGQRAFNFFDPTALSHHLFGQLIKYINLVSVDGYRWEDASFQKHIHNLAMKDLKVLRTLSDITKSEVHLRSTPFISLSKKLLNFLHYYESRKKYIPSASFWYAQKYIHRDWYKTDDTRVSIAYDTGTAIHPDVENDKEWIEEELISVIRDCLETNLKDGAYVEVTQLIGHLEVYLKGLAGGGGAFRSINVLKYVGDCVIDCSPISPGIAHKKALEKLASIERFTSVFITVALGFREYVERSISFDIEKNLLKINWKDNSSLYRSGFSDFFLPRLEWFAPRLNFEWLSEGQQITPIWYIECLIIQIEAEIFFKNTESLVVDAANIYREWIKDNMSDEHPWLAGAIMSREWEYWHKIDYQLSFWAEKWSSLSSKKIEGILWPDYDHQKLLLHIENRKLELLKSMSLQVLKFSLIDRPPGFPDYSGQFLHTFGEACLESLLKGKVELLDDVFKGYLIGCIARFESLLPKINPGDWRAQREIKIACAPLLDLMDLSGYGRLMADFHENQKLWEMIEFAWDAYISNADAQAVSRLSAAISLTKGAFEIPHRGILRTNWRMRINQVLKGVKRRDVLAGQFLSSRTVVDHSSALIRIFAQSDRGMGPYDGIDVFIAYYLSKKPGAEDIDFNRSGRDLGEMLERELKRYAPDDSEGRK